MTRHTHRRRTGCATVRAHFYRADPFSAARFSAPRRRQAAGSRRGVILLMVLALLSLFLLIGMTLVMISSQAKRSSRSAARAEKRLASAPEEILDAAMLQVIAGTNNGASVLRSHSLLEDMYGNDGIRARITTNVNYRYDGHLGEWPADPVYPNLTTAAEASGEFVCFTFNEFGPDLLPGVSGVDDDGNMTADASGPNLPDSLEFGWSGSDDTVTGLDEKPGVAGVDDNGNNVVDEGGLYPTGEVMAPGSDDYRVSPVNHYYAGRLVTMTSGAAAGQTRRIVGSVVRTNNPTTALPLQANAITLIVLRFDGGINDQPTEGDSFIINGRPFNGTGFGLSLKQLGVYSPTAVNPQPTTLPTAGDALSTYYSTFPANSSFILGAFDPKGPSPIDAPGPDNPPADNSIVLLGIKDNALATLNATPALDYGVRGTWPYALLPNPAAFSPSLMRTPANHGYLATYPPTLANLPDNYSLYPDPAGPGGADEDYDAVDFQNMLLAMRRNLPLPTFTGPPTPLDYLKYEPPIVEIPSLHRPDLISYWYTRIFADIKANPPLYGFGATPPNDAAIAAMIMNPTLTQGSVGSPVFNMSSVPLSARNRLLMLKRKIMLRPLREDHPNFTGSNSVHAGRTLAEYPLTSPGMTGGPQSFSATNFARDSWEISGVGMGNTGVNHTTPGTPASVIAPRWDIDNDNDGVGDSIWVDLGFPVQQTSDGKLYKPLAAILCIDMDNKFNLNAHGNPSQIASGLGPLPGTFAYSTTPTTGSVLTVPYGAGGQGYGPAEVNVGGVMSVYGWDGKPGTANLDDDGNTIFDDATELNYPLTDDRASMGYDGRPGQAYVDDNGDGFIDNIAEWGAAGSDDGTNFGPDGQPGVAGVDDDRNGFVDVIMINGINYPDMQEAGALGSDDQFEYMRLFRGMVNPLNLAQRIDGRYGEIWRSGPPTLGLGSFPPSPGIPNTQFNLVPPTNSTWALGQVNAFNAGWVTGELSDVLIDVDQPTFYRMPWNGAFGNTGVDDDGNGVTDFFNYGGVLVPDFAEAGWPLSDDLDPVAWARARSFYGTPHDLDGDGYVALDVRGQPLFLGSLGKTGVGEANERWDDPYELNLSLNAPRAGMQDLAGRIVSRDNPFQAAEIEVLMRSNDLDVSSLAGRLQLLTPTLAATPRLANLVTSDSWDLPIPSLVVPPELLMDNTTNPMNAERDETVFDATGNSTRRPGSLHLSDLIRNRILREQPEPVPPFTFVPDTGIDAAVNYVMTRLGYDLQANLKLNLNLPFGNGLDDLLYDGNMTGSARFRTNGVVDEPQEVSRANNAEDDDNSGTPDDATEVESAWANQLGAAVPLDLDRDGITALTDTTEGLARQQLAQQLYILMMAISRTAPQFAASDRFSMNMNAVAGAADDQQELARMIAQWAVNVVDYRDSDSIMTGFEYDIYPFRDDLAADNNTWDVDDLLGTPEAPTMGAPVFRGIVWGVERPELLITETLAYHDRRAEDKTNDPSGMDTAGGDTDLDQDMPPKGVLVVELYNPGSTPNALPGKAAIEGVSPEFAPQTVDPSGSPLPAIPYTGVQLNKRAGRSGEGYGASPVWRMVVAPFDSVNPGLYLETPKLADNANILSTDGFRYIYFADPGAGDREDGGAASTNRVRFFPTAGANPPRIIIPPRHYAVIAPQNQPMNPQGEAPNTLYIGNHTTGAGPGMFPAVFALAPSNDILSASQVLGFSGAAGGPVRAPLGDSGGLMWNDQIKSPIAIMIDSGDQPDPNYTGAPPMQMNISEPVGAYPLIDPTMMGKSRDIPFDEDTTLNRPGETTGLLAFNTLFNADDRTVSEYKLLLLQRLANPLDEWDSESNPYLTVDSLPIPLTVFHGRDVAATTFPTGLPIQFDSVQRGKNARSSAWLTEAKPAGMTQPAGYVTPEKMSTYLSSTPSTIDAPLNGSTLGYANYTYTPGVSEPLADPAANAVAAPRFTNATVTMVNYRPFGVANITDVIANVSAREFIGDVWQGVTVPPGPTADPPSWLNIPNRSFVSANELMQVPMLPSSRLLVQPTDATVGMNTLRYRGRTRGLDEAATGSNMYIPAITGGMNTIANYPFADMLNLFESTADSFNPGAAPVPAPPEFHRILDFVRVPSRFAGTSTVLNPRAGYFQGASAVVNQTLTVAASAFTLNPNGAQFFPFAAPFNTVSEYREPGKINLNTVFDPLVWQGLVNGSSGTPWSNGGTSGPGSDTRWGEFWQSRRGYPTATGEGGNLLSMVGDFVPTNLLPGGRAAYGDLVPSNNLDYPAGVSAGTRTTSTPTFFAKPFRAAGSEMLVPLESMRFPQSTNPDASAAPANVPRWEVENGLLRPVGEQDLVATPPARQPLLADTDEAQFRRSKDNPAFRYELLQKLGNVATTRSNVYAVWITIGRFEVERAPREAYPWYSDSEFQQVFPEGYRFGKEMGLDEGNVERRRGFYMFDRTIPMGFQRGEKLNTENGLILRRIIQ